VRLRSAIVLGFATSVLPCLAALGLFALREVAEGRDAAATAAAGVALASLGFALTAMLALLRHLAGPVRRMTAAMVSLAAGDTRVAVPTRAGLAEVGAMAGAVEVFRTNALRLHESEARYRLLAENAADMIVRTRADRTRAYVSPASHALLGYDPDELLGLDFATFLHSDDRDRVTATYERFRIEGGRTTCSYRLRHRDGHYVWVEAHWVTAAAEGLPGAPGGTEREVIAVVRDVSDRKAAEARIAHMARHDSLTDLPNRVLFRERMEQELAKVGRGGTMAVLCLDLDRFKVVNDTLGHAAGDALLRAVAGRLLACVRETDTVARLGGDEFAIVQAGLHQPEDAGVLARRILEAIEQPFDLDGHRIVAGTSIGIVVAPDDGAQPDQLLKSADLALYRAKAAGRHTYRFFEPEMDARVQARQAMELDLREALAAGGGGFELFYQPIFDLGSDAISSFEALLRWRHPARGMVSPAEFIPVAEETGLIVPLGTWVLRQACADAASWPGDHLTVAVNVSPVQFRDRELVQAVADALAAATLPARRLELEITESVLLHNNEANLAGLHDLHRLGVRIAMDDFGTGYSSLCNLRSFPFDRIKIDQAFIRDLTTQADSCAIVRAIVGLGDALGMATTAEGVETQAQLALLRAEGVTQAQGYLFSPPRPASEMAALLAAAQSSVRAAA